MSSLRRAASLGIIYCFLYSLYLITQEHLVRTQIHPLHLNFLAYLTALVLLLLYKLVRPHLSLLPRSTKGVPAAILSTLLVNIMGDLSLMFGLITASSINWSITSRLKPAVTLLFSLLFLRQTFTKRQLLAIMIALFGAYIVIKPPTQLALDTGDLLFIAALVGYSLGNVTAQKALTQMSLTHFVTIRLSLTTILMSVMVFLLYPLTHLTSLGMILFVGTMIVVGNFLVSAVIQSSSAVFFELIGNLVPLFTIVFSSIILKELPSVYQILGGSLVILSLIVYYRYSAPKNRFSFLRLSRFIHL